MGEPITIWGADGVMHTLYGAATVAALVASGQYSYEPPAEKPKEAQPAADEREAAEKPATRKGKSGK